MSLRNSDRARFDGPAYIDHRKLDINSLSSGMKDIADLIGFYGYQEALWDSAMKSLKNELEIAEAKIHLDIKAGTEKFTVAQADAYVTVHPDVVKLKRALLEAEEEKRLYTSAVNALNEKAKQLQSLSARERSEKSMYGVTHMAPEYNHTIPTSGYHMGGYVSPSISPAVVTGGTISASTTTNNTDALKKAVAELIAQREIEAPKKA